MPKRNPEEPRPRRTQREKKKKKNKNRERKVRDPGQAGPRAPCTTQARPGHAHCARPKPTDPGSSLFLVFGFFFFFFSGFFSDMFCWLLCFSPFHLLVVVFLGFILFFIFWCILTCTRDLRVQIFLNFF